MGGIDSRKLIVHADDRGNVRETFRASWYPEMPPVVQMVRSESKAGTLRGMHIHREQWDVWTFVKGWAYVRLDDEVQAFHADSTIVIPPGIAHGFYTPLGCILLYGLTREYDGTDEAGWYPFDGLPTPFDGLRHRWPVSPEGLLVSDRDLNAPPR